MRRKEGLRIAAYRTSGEEVSSATRFRGWIKSHAPTVSPFAQTSTVEGMGTRYCDQPCDSRVHSFQTDRASR